VLAVTAEVVFVLLFPVLVWCQFAAIEWWHHADAVRMTIGEWGYSSGWRATTAILSTWTSILLVIQVVILAVLSVLYAIAVARMVLFRPRRIPRVILAWMIVVAATVLLWIPTGSETLPGNSRQVLGVTRALAIAWNDGNLWLNGDETIVVDSQHALIIKPWIIVPCC
jgi:hypothetical protein